MARQESIGAPAPSDVDLEAQPHSTATAGDNSSETQTVSIEVEDADIRHPPDDSQIEAQPHSTATAGDNSAETQTVSTEVEDADIQHPLDDSQIEAQPHSSATAGDNSAEAQTALSEAEAVAEILRTTPQLMYGYRHLYNAAKNGDWKAAEKFVGNNRNLWLERITTRGDTPVMVAARSLQWEFVEKLVGKLTEDELRMQNTSGFTVLHLVAFSESVKTAKILVRKCNQLTQIASVDGKTPLLTSLQRPHKDMVWYLAVVTTFEHDRRTSCPFTGDLSGELFRYLTYAGFNDITLYLLRRRQRHGFTEYPSRNANATSHLLCWLSVVPSNVVINKNSLNFIERCLYKFFHVEIGVPPPSLRNREGASALNPPESSRTFLSQGLQCLKMLLWKVSEQLVPCLKRVREVREAKLQHVCAKKIVETFCTSFGTNLSFREVVDKLTPVMLFATIGGNVEIIRICLEHFPDMISVPIGEHGNILRYAIKQRQEEIFNLITEIPTIGYSLAEPRDDPEDTILKISAKLAPSLQLLSVSGPALQMQRELQWFEEVKELVAPISRGVRTTLGRTIMDNFMQHHKKLAEEGEKWMKDTANSCMIVTTLIATVVFAAVFTVPGGNVADTGIPFFLQRPDFLVFIIADALAFFSSSTSLLMFLSILTARYAPEDFLLKLPRRLIVGLGSLFFAIITMMVAFGAALYMVLKERWKLIYIPIIFLACIPVLIFAKQQVPLFYDLVQSTYGSGVFKKKKTR